MRLGIDVGGTKIEIIAIDNDGETLLRRRVPTPQGDYTATLAAIRDLVVGAEEETGCTGSVGVGIPGSLSPLTGLVRNANSTWINGHAFDRDLARLLGRPVRVQNDANCLAVSEATDGAGAGDNVVFAAILGTGVGAGIAINGRPLTGRHAIAGEWGHNPLPWPQGEELPGPPCFCGKRGCVETFLSGPGLARDYLKWSGAERSGPEIVALAGAGSAGGPESEAVAALERYLDRLARSLAGVINIVDPDVVVFGGGLSAIDLLYEQLPQRLPRYVFAETCSTPLRRAQHGDSSGVRGAAWLWS
jgi:fructokinase